MSEILYHKFGDLVEDKSIDVFCHQTNCFGKMGAGIAYQIANKYPDAARRDKEYYNEQIKKYGTNVNMVGTILPVILPDKRICINMYAQYAPGRAVVKTELDSDIYSNNNYENIDSRELREDYFKSTLECLTTYLNDPICVERLKTVGFPKYIGCGIAGGIWNNYWNMITEFAKTVSQDVYLVELEK